MTPSPYSPSIHEGPELIAQEFSRLAGPFHIELGLNESPELIAQESELAQPMKQLPRASMKVLSLLLRNCDARPDRRKQSGLNESPELIAQEL